MKRKCGKKRQMMAALLTIAMAASLLTGCGGKNSTGEENGADGGTTAASSKEGVWRVEEMGLDISSIYDTIIKNGDGMLAYGINVVYPEGTYDAEDAADVIVGNQTTQADTVEDADTTDDAEIDEADTAVSDAGSITVRVAILDENGQVEKETSMTYDSVNQGISVIGADSEGHLYLFRDQYVDVPDENGYYNDVMSIEKWDMDGNQLMDVVISDTAEAQKVREENDGWVSCNMRELLDGQLYVGLNNMVLVLDTETGEVVRSIDTSDTGQDDSGYSTRATDSTILELADGTLAGITYQSDGVYVGTVNLNTFLLEDLTKIPQGYSLFSFYAGADNREIVATTESGIYSFHIGDTETTELMNFVNSDFINSPNEIFFANETTFYATYYDQDDDTAKLGKFTKVDPADIADQKELTLGCLGLNYDVLGAVVAFNKENTEYRISMKDYNSLYNTDDDSTVGLTKLNADIVSGNIPDILVISNDMPADSYIAKGVFEDLNPYIEQDAEIDADNLMPNIMEAFSTDGKLYRLVPSYEIVTAIAKTSLVGEERGWTAEEATAIMNTLSDDAEFMDGTTREELLNYSMRASGDQFIDWENGTCSFDSDEFKGLLTFLGQIQSEEERANLSEDYWDNYYLNYDSMWRENRALTRFYYISSFDDYNYSEKGTFGEDITLIGFPTGDGDGSAIWADLELAMSAKSPYKEGAWQFLRTYLLDDYQNEITYGFPLSIKRLNEMGEEAQQMLYYLDENGEKVEYNNTYSLNGVEIEILPMSEEEVEKFKEILYSFKKVYTNQDELLSIITEEAAAFFSGQKTVDAVAEIIQSRAQIYVNENS